MNPFEFVLAIMFMVFAFSLLKHRLGIRNRWEHPPVEDQAENRRLREEVSELKERIKVLERITVDKENSLARQIDELRDR
jgi:hypothetical protein